MRETTDGRNKTPDARRQTPVKVTVGAAMRKAPVKASIRRYQDLVAWQKAMDLVENVYAISNAFPREELYGLTSQLRRAAVSVPSNIAEGHARTGRRELANRLSIALGSSGEVETQMLIAERLGYVDSAVVASFMAAASETGRVIVGLMNSLEKHAAAS